LNLLASFAAMSQTVGARLDYVQGGGGNTSVKLGDGLMAIKASGFRLNQVTENDCFAVVETGTLKDVTAACGYKPLRPSVEASFHALLGTFVIHTHPVYANLAMCSASGTDRLPAAMDGLPYIVAPYINPGVELSMAIKERLRPDTRVVFLVNHGLVVTADDAQGAMALHDEVNERLASAYGVSRADFDCFAREAAKMLYPDQQVYLDLTQAQREIMAAVMFIHFTLMKNGGTAQAMGAEALSYISGWEGEAYRKSILR